MFESLEGIWSSRVSAYRFLLGSEWARLQHRRLHPGKVNMKRYLLAITVLTLPWAAVAASPTAKVEQGVLKGTREGSLTVYRGIPFAAPPIGDLRWRPPQPPAKWQGTRTADKFAPNACRIPAARKPRSLPR